MITNIKEFKLLNEAHKLFRATSPDAMELQDRLKDLKGIVRVGIESVSKANVYYNDKFWDESKLQQRVDAENKSIKESKSVNEGTWALNQSEIPNFISDVELLKQKYYNSIGDDILFDELDGAISRAELLAGYISDKYPGIQLKK